MNKPAIKRQVTLTVVKELAQKKEYYLPAAVSNHHAHLSKAALYALFGDGYELGELRALTQPGQYACKEQVTLIGPKGRLEGLRILGPARPATQVEVTLSDTFTLGIEPAVRMSGDVTGTPGGTLLGPKGEYELKEGVIVAKRHLHISEEEASLFGLKNGDIVGAKKTGERETTFGNILVRVGAGHSLELHLDTDEANAAGIKNGDILEMIR